MNGSLYYVKLFAVLLGVVVVFGGFLLVVMKSTPSAPPTPIATHGSPSVAAPGEEITGTEANFAAEVLEADVPVLVDFWASWCGPCRQMTPIVSELAKDYAGRAKVVKVNVDENRALSGTYNISGIPCFIIFKDGKEVTRLVGSGPKERLSSALDGAL